MDGRCVNESNVILERREWSLADSTACPSMALAVDLILLFRHRDGHADVVVPSLQQQLGAVTLKHPTSLTAVPRRFHLCTVTALAAAPSAIARRSPDESGNDSGQDIHLHTAR